MFRLTLVSGNKFSQTIIHEENNTSDKIDKHEESYQCEICEMKTKSKISLGKHMQKEHSTISQFDG